MTAEMSGQYKPDLLIITQLCCQNRLHPVLQINSINCLNDIYMIIYCCKSIAGAMNVISPFDRVISFSYYDGATSGITRCKTCGNEYVFELLSWDANQDIRIFGLSLVPSGSFEKISALGIKIDVPRWPEWQPVLTDKKLIADQVALENEMKSVTSTKDPITLVVAAESLTQKINSVKNVVLSDAKLPPLQECLEERAFLKWQAFLAAK
jgi:hypothetical protein